MVHRIVQTQHTKVLDHPHEDGRKAHGHDVERSKQRPRHAKGDETGGEH